jgi:hypothetical protein
MIEAERSGNIVFRQGQGVAGTDFNELNAPYDAEVVGETVPGAYGAVLTR